jgi:hypothetical protein
MPSGISHILLARHFQDQLPIGKLKKRLASGRYFFQVGAVGPDLPYASILDDDLFLFDQGDLADKMHHQVTNQIPLRVLPKIKAIPAINLLRTKEKRFKFAFFLGYMAHIVSDGLFHPFVRDKVGNYVGNETDHRVLEMRMDVLIYHHFYAPTGAQGEFNYVNLHDELRNIETSRQTPKVMQTYRNSIEEVYNEDHDLDRVQGWSEGLYRLFAVAEGDHPAIYRNLKILDGIIFKNYDDLKDKSDDILVLTTPKDRAENFLHTDRIHVIDDCIPKFVDVFTPLAIKAHDYVYKNGAELTEDDLPNINLDTGRPADRHHDLDLIPTLWS